MRNLWLENCQKRGNWNVNYGYVCSKHFRKDDFIRDMQAELLGYKGRRKLKPFAVPCLNIPNGDEVINKIPSETEKNLKTKEQNEKYDRLMEECMLTKKNDIPLTYKIFMQHYDKNHKKTRKNDNKVYTRPEFHSVAIPEGKSGK